MKPKHWLTGVSVVVALACFLFGGVAMSGAATVAIGAVLAIWILAMKCSEAAPFVAKLLFGTKFQRLVIDAVITIAAFILAGGAAGVLTGLFVSTALEWISVGEKHEETIQWTAECGQERDQSC